MLDARSGLIDRQFVESSSDPKEERRFRFAEIGQGLAATLFGFFRKKHIAHSDTDKRSPPPACDSLNITFSLQIGDPACRLFLGGPFRTGTERHLHVDGVEPAAELPADSAETPDLAETA